jgi:DNA-binding transcriptional ArsR family regulator
MVWMGTTVAAKADRGFSPVGDWQDCPAPDDLDLSTVLHALSDPMRLRIVAGLASEGDKACKAFDLPIAKSTCAHHFRVLRESGVIRHRVEGTTRINSLRREELDARFPGLLDAVLRAASRRPALLD